MNIYSRFLHINVLTPLDLLKAVEQETPLYNELLHQWTSTLDEFPICFFLNNSQKKTFKPFIFQVKIFLG